MLKVFQGFILEVNKYIGVEKITLIGILSILFLDLIMDLTRCWKVNKALCLKDNIKTYIFKNFLTLFLLFTINCFTNEFQLIKYLHNSILIIFVLDNLVKIFNDMAVVTGETAFIEISKFLNRQLKIFKSKEKEEKEAKDTDA